jgi:hypothetical protein
MPFLPANNISNGSNVQIININELRLARILVDANICALAAEKRSSCPVSIIHTRKINAQGSSTFRSNGTMGKGVSLQEEAVRYGGCLEQELALSSTPLRIIWALVPLPAVIQLVFTK